MTTTHDLDELKDVTIPQMDEQRGDGLPRLWWKYGNQPARQSGHFYVRGDDWDGAPPAPWAEVDLYSDEIGYKAEVLRIVPILKRAQPYRRLRIGDKTTRVYVDWPARGSWPEGMQIHTELLCLVEGLSGPVVFSYHGATGQAMEGKGGILATAGTLLAKEASKLYSRKISLSAFWVPIGPATKPSTKPNAPAVVDFVKLPQGSFINPPSLRLPDLSGVELLSAHYVGKAVLAEVGELAQQYADWQAERRGGDEVAEEAAPVTIAAPAPSKAAPKPPTRNQPKPIDDDGLFDE